MYINPANVDQVNKQLNLNGDVRAIIDPRLGSKYPLDEYREVIEIAVQCTRYDKNDRLKMQVSIHVHTHTHTHTHTHVFTYSHIYAIPHAYMPT